MSDLVDMLQELEDTVYSYEICVNPHHLTSDSITDYIGPYYSKICGEELIAEAEIKGRLIKVTVWTDSVFGGHWNVYHYRLCDAIGEALKILKGK